MRKLYAGQEATVRTRHEQQTGSKLGQEYIKAVYLLFNFYVEYIVLIARLDESQAGIKTSKRNVNNFRYADDIRKSTKSLLLRVKKLA